MQKLDSHHRRLPGALNFVPVPPGQVDEGVGDLEAESDEIPLLLQQVIQRGRGLHSLKVAGHS